MNKEQITWFKKILSINQDIESDIKKFVTLTTNKKESIYEINFKINNFTNPEIFLYLNELYEILKNDFNISFNTSSNNFDAIKNSVCRVLNISNKSDIDIFTKDKKYYIHCLNKEIFNKINNPINLEFLYSLGITHPDMFLFMEEEKIKISKPTETKLLFTNNGFSEYLLKLNEINEESNSIEKVLNADNKNKKMIIEGEIFEITEDFFSRSNVRTFKFLITNYKKAITLKYVFSPKSKNLNKNITQEYLKLFKKWMWIKAEILLVEDSFEHNDLIGNINKIIPISKPDDYKDVDLYDKKRIELNLHTNMSSFDGLNSPEQIINNLKEKGMNVISVNDFNNVQSFPTFYRLAKKNNIDLIYGAELTLAKEIDAIYNASHTKITDSTRFVFFDLETTGLSPNYGEIIEFGAYITDIYQNKIDTIQQFIGIDGEIEDKITKLTRITNNDLKNKPEIKEFLIKLQSIIKPTDILVAHNGIDFDIKFLNAMCRKSNLPEFKNPLIDTLVISRALLVDLSYHTLGRVSRYFDLEYDDSIAHRADADSIYLNNIFWRLMSYIPKWEERYLDEMNDWLKSQSNLYRRSYFNRVCIQAKYANYKNESSIKKLYELISIAHTKEFNDKPLIYEKTLNEYREWFLLSCPAVDSDLFEYGLKENDEFILNWMKKFDYVQIAPISAYKHLFVTYGKDTVEKNLKHLIELAKNNDIKLVATSNAYYMQQYSMQFHRIYILTKSLGGKRHRFLNLKEDPLNTFTPDLHVRTTQEMLDEMSLLEDDIEYVKKIVIDNPNEIYKSIDNNLVPIQNGLFPPTIEGVEDKLKQTVYDNARLKYGNNLPKFVEDRIEFELNIIIKNGYSVVYWISHLLVAQSLNDGFLVGSRGSVGSSLVATFLNITEINPLQAHYYCKECSYFELIDNYLGSGYDLKEKKCPKCKFKLISEGQNIPFATFLGFDGDKIPDIDLNFSGLYQSKAHNFIKQMFGEQNAFRAGTIATVAEKTAYAYVKEFLSQVDFSTIYSNAQMRWLVLNCMNVKRTTGQHPGGIVIIPQDKSVYDFTPYNYPADDNTLDWYTTHFAFEDIHDNILKFDILGHDDPTILKYLKDLTNIDPRTIPTYDEKVISLFSSTDALNIKNNPINYHEKNAAIGLPEFGTRFVREMLNETKPKTFSDLIRISGLSHGTDVWANNAQNLVKEGKKLTDLVTCRDDIMTNLSALGIEPLKAFKIMEDIRKGKGLKQEDENLLKEKHVPDWYIKSCKKIVYLFPKAHAAAYVLTAWRIAWFKVYYPLEYYATYFSVRCEVFDIESMKNGTKAIYDKLRDIQTRKSDKKLSLDVSKKELDLLSVLEVALEMSVRGYKFSNIDLKKSSATQFIIDYENNSIIPPFVVIDGLGEAVANSIIEAREKHEFVSIQDFKDRTKVNKTQIKNLEELGVFENLNENNQLTFNFDL